MAPVVEVIGKSIWMLGSVAAIVGLGAINVTSVAIGVRANGLLTAAAGGWVFDVWRGLGVS